MQKLVTLLYTKGLYKQTATHNNYLPTRGLTGMQLKRNGVDEERTSPPLHVLMVQISNNQPDILLPCQYW